MKECTVKKNLLRRQAGALRRLALGTLRRLALGALRGVKPTVEGGDGRPRSGLEAGVGVDPQVRSFPPLNRHRINQRFAAGFLVFLLVSCKSQAKFSQYAPVVMADRKNYFLLPPEAIERSL